MTSRDPQRPEKDVAFPRTTHALGADIKNSPEVLDADEIRRADDQETAVRQEELDEVQREISRTLEANANRLSRTAAEIQRVEEFAADNREGTEELRERVEELQRDTADLLDGIADDTDVR